MTDLTREEVGAHIKRAYAWSTSSWPKGVLDTMADAERVTIEILIADSEKYGQALIAAWDALDGISNIDAKRSREMAHDISIHFGFLERQIRKIKKLARNALPKPQGGK